MSAPRIAYLDNAATTRCDPRVADAVRRILVEEYGNPSSVHPLGVRAARAMREARETVARALGCEPSGVVFTASGTEANNLALLGFARASKRRRHFVVSAVEHPSVLETTKALAAEGFETTTVPVDRTGRVDPARVAEAARPDTAIAAVMLANNEVGTIEPVAEVARALRSRAPDAHFHVDAVQAFGKVAVSFRSTGADSIAVSSHKIHGPKGVGALALATNRKPLPLLFGGGQEGGLRSGTENTAGIVGFARAVALAHENLDAESGRLRGLRDRLAEGLRARVPDAIANGDLERGLPTVLSVSFPGLPGEALLHHLEARGVFVATGAACHAKASAHSHVLVAMGLPEDAIRGTIRFSLGRFTTEEDVDLALGATPAAVAELRALASG